MKKDEFKKLYEEYVKDENLNTTNENNKEGIDNKWNNALKAWEVYREQIKEGLPLEKWLKNDAGYLPDFLDTKEKFFGHARIGNYDQVMIYKYTGKDEKRKDRYYDFYNNRYNEHFCDKKEEIEQDYKENIQSLIKALVDANSLDEIYKLEKDKKYDDFRCKQILRKITVLESLREDSNYKNAFMWIYADKVINKLAEIFDEVIEIEDNTTFFEKNQKIYEKAKEWLNIKDKFEKIDFRKLNSFLWFLTDSSLNIEEFSDFNSINIIFNGAPGTGKTYGVINGIKKLQNINNVKYKKSKYIQFHPSYTYQDFIEGIKPLEMVGGNLNLSVVNGSFKQFCIYVKKENENYYEGLDEKPNINKSSEFKDWPHYYFIVDEINRGNLSNIFGETFTLLEKDYRDYDFSKEYTKTNIKLVSTPLSSVISQLDNNDDLIYKKINDEVYFGIPFNIHFIGMMNDVDRSIDTFDLALRRRFKWISKQCDYDVLEKELDKDKTFDAETIRSYVDSCEKLNNWISKDKDGLRLGKNYEFGHAFFLKIKDFSGSKKITKSKKVDLFDNYILGTLTEYIRQVADESEIDDYINKAKKAFGI